MWITIRLALATVAVAAAVAVLDAGTALAGTVESAPGRIIFPIADGDAWLVSAIALPAGGALLVGQVEGSGRVYVAKVSQSGGLDPSFGLGGVAAIDAELAFEQILLQPDGSILLVGMRSARGHFAELRWNERHGYLVAVRLNADGSIDRSYGTGGTAQTPLEGGCYCHRIALEQEGQKLVVTGQREMILSEHGESRESYSWALARLNQTGSLDDSFGQNGIAVVSGQDGVGLSISASEDGTIVAQGQANVTSKNGSSGPENLMTRLSADGAPDRTYAGGIPFALPVFALDDSYGQTPQPLESFVESDGRVLVETFPVPANPGQPKNDLGVGLLGLDSSGRLDHSFGYGGYLNLEEGPEPSGSELLPAPDGGLLAVHRRGSTRPSENRRLVPGIIEFERINHAGLLEASFAKPPGIAVDIPFGGGLGEPGPLSRYSYPETEFTLDQDTFLGPRSSAIPLPQPDGSYLLAGTVTLSSPAAPHVPESTTARFALASLTSSFGLDAAFGGPAHVPTAAIRAPQQSTQEDLAHRRTLVEVSMSAPGVAVIRLFTDGHQLARKLIALLGSGQTRVAIPLSGAARRYLRLHHRTRLQGTIDVRDLLAEGGSGSTEFVLR